MTTHLEPAAVEQRTWAIVEVLGHSSYGGAVREIERLGVKFLEVSVMETVRNREFTMLLSPASIFRMRETTEAAARANYSSIPDEHRIELPRAGRLNYENGDPPAGADAATSIESMFDDLGRENFSDEDEL